MKLAAFRRTDEPVAVRHVGLVVGNSDWRIHPFVEGTDLVELLAADPARHKAFLMKASLLESARRAAQHKLS